MFFGVTLVQANLCLHTFIYKIVTLPGVKGKNYFKSPRAAEKFFVVSENSWKDLKRSFRVL